MSATIAAAEFSGREIGAPLLEQLHHLRPRIPGAFDDRVDLGGRQEPGERRSVYRSLAQRDDHFGSMTPERDRRDVLGPGDAGEGNRRAESAPSRTPAMPETRSGGKPVAFAIKCGHFLERIGHHDHDRVGAFCRMPSPTAVMMAAFTPVRSVRLMPGRRGRPAVTTI